MERLAEGLDGITHHRQISSCCSRISPEAKERAAIQMFEQLKLLTEGGCINANFDQSQLNGIFTSGGSKSKKGSIAKARKLLQKFVQKLKCEKFEKVKEIQSELIQIIEDHVTTTAAELEYFGVKCLHFGKYLEAMFFVYAAFIFHKKDTNLERVCIALWRCGEILTRVAKRLMMETSTFKPVVQKHLISLLHRFQQTVRENSMAVQERSGNKAAERAKEMCFFESHCCYHVAHVQLLIEDWNEREKTLREAIIHIQKIFGEDSKKLILYGDLLSSMGCTLSQLSRFKESADYHKLSKDVFHETHAGKYHEDKSSLEKRLKDANLFWKLALRNTAATDCDEIQP